MSGELWSRTRAAVFLDILPTSVQRVMSRRGYTPAGRMPGGGRESLWQADDVRDYLDSRHPRNGRDRTRPRTTD